MEIPAFTQKLYQEFLSRKSGINMQTRAVGRTARLTILSAWKLKSLDNVKFFKFTKGPKFFSNQCYSYRLEESPIVGSQRNVYNFNLFQCKMSMEYENIWGGMQTLTLSLKLEKGHYSVSAWPSYLFLSTGLGHDGEHVCKVSKPYFNEVWICGGTQTLTY
jgi:hypothetical protein